jgi:hypothetical protein
MLLLGSAGCSMTLDASNLGVPATLASSAGTPVEGTSFSVTSHAVYGLWGLVRFSQPSLQKALASQLAGGKEVANVRVHIRSRLGDLIITALTLGLIVPRAVTFEGVVVQ